jgi:hypothetical protein
MRSWLYLLLAAVVVYFAYRSWFAVGDSDAPEDTAGAGPIQVVPAPAPPAETEEEEVPAAPKSLRLDTAGGAAPPVDPAREPSQILWRERADALDSGELDRARVLEQRILSEFPNSDAARWVQFEEGKREWREYRRLGKSGDGLRHAHRARQLLTPALFLKRTRKEERELLRRTLRELAEAVVFSRRHVEGADFSYVPKRGDNLDTLCRRAFPKKGSRIAPGLVAAVNRMKSPSALRAGEASKVPRGAAGIVVMKREFRLYYLLDGAYVRDYAVGLGRDDLTPETEFVIGGKMKNPDWFPRPGEKIAFGDPRNILGTRWLGFENSRDFAGFGIHGTREPDTIGKNSSSGCVRMHQRDVEEVFDWTPVGARVRILP